ncbi:MAG: DUF420 domain-containing protein [Bacteroidetes bacterium]|nr:DUF420 domain-containing protein [Bacteroidota bacterium]
MLQAQMRKNDKLAVRLIWVISFILFTVIVILNRVKVNVNLGFDVHLFALFNAIINSIVSILLVAGLIAIRSKHYLLHKRIMLSALILSVLFLISYVCHHLFAGESKFGDIDHNGVLSEAEKTAAGGKRLLYFIILATHIPLAGIVLPFILFTAYRALTAEWPRHRKIAKITWPIWLYVSITGVLVYYMISPYY